MKRCFVSEQPVISVCYLVRTSDSRYDASFSSISEALAYCTDVVNKYDGVFVFDVVKRTNEFYTIDFTDDNEFKE